MFLCVHICFPGGAKRQSSVYFLRLSLHLFLYSVFCWPRTCPGILLCLLPQCWDYKNIPQCSACLLYLLNYLFVVGSEDWTKIYMFQRQSLYQLSHLPQTLTELQIPFEMQISSPAKAHEARTSSLGNKVTNWSSYHIGSTMCRKPLSLGTADHPVSAPYAQQTLQHSPQQYGTLTQTTLAQKSLSIWGYLEPEPHGVALSECSVELSVGGSHTVLLLFLLELLCKFNLVLLSYSTISSTRPYSWFTW